MAEFSSLNGYDVKDKKAIRYYDNVADMKSDESIKEGQTIATLGYYSVNDGGSSEYYITNTESLTEYQEDLNNGLYATLIIKNEMNIECFGGKGDNSYNNSQALTNALNSCTNIIFNSGTYLFGTPIYYTDTENKKIIGNGYTNSILKGLEIHLNTLDDNSWVNAYSSIYFEFENIKFINNNNTQCIYTFQPIKMVQCKLDYYDKFLTLGSSSIYIDQIYLDNIAITNHAGNDYAFELNILGDEHTLRCIHKTSGTNEKVINCRGKRGICFNNCINGYYHINNSNTRFIDCHFEHGGIEIDNALANTNVVDIVNCFFYSNVKLPTGKFIKYDNCCFFITPNIDHITSDYNNYLELNTNNCIIKCSENDNITTNGLVRLDMNNNNTIMAYSGNKVATGNGNGGLNGYFKGEKNVEYTYHVYASKMKNAINGSDYDYSVYEFTIIPTSTTNLVRIQGIGSSKQNCFIHVYREISSLNKIEVAVIPNSGEHLYDYGECINGILWEEVQSVPVLTKSNIDIINDVVKVNSGTLNGNNYLYIDSSDNIIKYKV